MLIILNMVVYLIKSTYYILKKLRDSLMLDSLNGVYEVNRANEIR